MKSILFFAVLLVSAVVAVDAAWSFPGKTPQQVYDMYMDAISALEKSKFNEAEAGMVGNIKETIELLKSQQTFIDADAAVNGARK